jgi:hypothetical protein
LTFEDSGETASSTTPAERYSATVIYTAVPRF